jgi:hypothetical protein
MVLELIDRIDLGCPKYSLYEAQPPHNLLPSSLIQKLVHLRNHTENVIQLFVGSPRDLFVMDADWLRTALNQLSSVHPENLAYLCIIHGCLLFYPKITQKQADCQKLP